jgi:hypothetical protein
LDIVLWILISVYAIYALIMIPVQYSYIAETKQRFKEKNKSHNEIYDEMSFEEQQLQYNLQGSLYNLPSTLIATLIYKIRNPKD